MQIETCARGRKTSLKIDKNHFLNSKVDLEQVALPITSEDSVAEKGTKITLYSLNQNLTFPTPEGLKALLIQDYGRSPEFSIFVNLQRITIEDISGPTIRHSQMLENAGTSFLVFTIAEGGKKLKKPGIVIKVNGKMVGSKPHFFVLQDDKEIPEKLLKKVYSEVEVDGLEESVTADWGAISENSKGYQELCDYVATQVKNALYETHKREIGLQKARLQAEIKRRLEGLPEHRRKFADAAINRILYKFYGEKDERINALASLLLDATEKDEYWEILKKYMNPRV
ncbi:MAG: hypothetical protein SGJ17_03030 [Hyphomicrobiales bacterium]|nr:hypothetical protein [Hyphomicrobiales bacterium]